ncbi:hypothetical protein JTE90_000612 [Oedothorax gibbosus]|uniref:HMG box domain-containing protein n=1 Tax=Oedothorax gibbosus TaxID=931172 RepID=A0AAV6VV55_9ARAC|nr:hypothetical protein JTE90_000612 [Oedothorax gibbosus]
MEKYAKKEETAKRGSTTPLEPRLANLILHPRSAEKIARPPNAFMIFAQENRKALAMKYPEHSNKAISSMLGQWWKGLGVSSKKKYFDQSKMMHELHKKQHPGYVYSPRVARMKKEEKKRFRKLKSQSKKQKKENDDESETVTFYKMEDTEAISPVDLKPATPEYVPNNPQFFSNETNSVETNQEETSSMTSEDQVQSAQHPSPPSFQPSPPSFQISPTFQPLPPSYGPPSSLGRAPEELGLQPPFLEPYYRQRPILCGCVQCEQGRAYAYGTPMYPRWNPHGIDYMNEYGAMSPTRSYNPSTEHSDYKNHLFSPYQHYPSHASFENSHRFQYDPFHDFRTGCYSCPPYMRCHMSYGDNPRSLHGNPSNTHMQYPGWFPDSRCTYFPPSSVSDSRYCPPRPKTGQCIEYGDRVQYRDLDSNSLHLSHHVPKSKPFHATDIEASTENSNFPNGKSLEADPFSSNSMEANKNLIDENIEAETVEADPLLSSTIPVEEESSEQVDNASDHPCLQATDSCQSDQFHDCEGIPLEKIPTIFYANDSNEQNARILTNDSLIEPNFRNFELPSDVACYAYYESDVGFQFEGFVNQAFKNNDDEVINVVDVEEVSQASNIEAKESVVVKTDAQAEQSIQ